MVTAHVDSGELIWRERAVLGVDSSAVLLGLMALSRRAEAAAADLDGPDPLDGVISKGVLRSLLSALHFRDVRTVRHSRRTAMLAVGMARYLGWEGRHLKLLEISALLHDIGKIGVPDNILFKPGRLSPEEYGLMSLHYNIGLDVLQATRVDKEVLEIVGQSHDHFNGVNDFFRRVGSDMHLGARILAVADAYDSLRTEQVYRDGQAHEDIMQVLMRSAGTQFDGNVVCALSRWAEKGGLPYSQNAADMTAIDRFPGPANPQEALEASSLGHIFSYLYLLESLYDGFYLVDSDLRFVVWNRGAEHLLGHSSRDILDRVWTSRLLGYSGRHGEQLADHDIPLSQVLETGKPLTLMACIQHADGHSVDVELQSVPLLDRDGQLRGVAEIFRGVSRASRRPQEYCELKQAAKQDPLTSVANRGELEFQLAALVVRASQAADAEPLSAIFLDIDFFKEINDSYGHSVGDQVLIDVTRLLQHETYSGELVGRYGGEEFVILCPATELDQAVRRAERLRVAISRASVAGLTDFQCTVSFGVTQAEPGDSVESILRRADKALYMAKATGRNRTCSLTNAELLAQDMPIEKSSQEPDEPFVFCGSFSACVAADMVVYKLGGFVNDQPAKLVEVTPKRVVIQLGNRGLLPFWGSKDQGRPVIMDVEFGDADVAPSRGNGSGTTRVLVTVRIRPVGWIKDADLFRARAQRALKILKSYFIAE